MRKSFKMIVFYDNWCPMCQRIKNNIEKLDWLNLVILVDFRGREKEVGISRKKLEREMHAIILHNNNVVSGFDAFVALSLRTPLLSFLWPLLMLLNVGGIGPKLYNMIAKRRNIVPIGHCNNGESCIIKK